VARNGVLLLGSTYIQNRQEYAEVCEDVAALHEMALAERNLRRITPDMPPDQEKE